MKYLVLFITLATTTGCAVTQWLVENEGAVDAAGDATGAAGPYGAIVGLALTTAVGAAKWWEGKAETKEVVGAFQKAKKELSPEAKKILVDGLDKHMPSKIKKLVAKVKKKL